MEVMVVKNFRFEEGDRVALSGVPETPEAADWLADQGVRTVVSLHPVEAAVVERLRERGVRHVPFVLQNFSEPLPGSLPELLADVQRTAAAAPAVLIH